MWPQPRDSRVCWEDPSASGCQAVGPAAGDTRPRVPLSCPVASGQSSKQKPLCCGGSGHSRARQAGNKGPAGPGVLSGSVKCRTCALYTRGGGGHEPGTDFRGEPVLPRLGPRPWDALTFIGCRGKELLGAHGRLEERGGSEAEGPRAAGVGRLGHEGCPWAHAAPPHSPALLQARGHTGHSAQDWGTTGAPLGRNAGLSVAVRWRLGLGDPGTPQWCQHQRSRCSHPPEPNGPQTTARHTLDHQGTGPGTVATIKSPSECPGEQATQSGVSPPRVRAGWFLVDPASLSSRVHEATGLGSALGRSGSGRGPPLCVARRPHSS